MFFQMNFTFLKRQVNFKKKFHPAKHLRPLKQKKKMCNEKFAFIWPRSRIVWCLIGDQKRGNREHFPVISQRPSTSKLISLRDSQLVEWPIGQKSCFRLSRLIFLFLFLSSIIFFLFMHCFLNLKISSVSVTALA